jgi:hypothetical protein
MFDWDEGNISHIAEHGVSPDEAEEVVLNIRWTLTTAWKTERSVFGRLGRQPRDEF